MRTNSRALFALFAFLPGMVCGCGSNGKPAAIVNGHVITVQDVNDRLAAMNPQTRAAFAGQKGRLLDQMVVEEVLLQEAYKRGLERDPEVRRLFDEARRQILVARLLDNLRKEKGAPIPDEQIAQFYHSNKASFMQPESYRVSHILLPDEETAKKALERVKSGEPFSKVAAEMSTDPSKARGGDIGFFSKGQVIPEFEEACAKLKPGEMSGIVKTPLGYHIILMVEQKPAHQKSLDEVRDQIRQVLQNQEGRQVVQGAVQELRSKAQIKIRENFSAPSSQKPAS